MKLFLKIFSVLLASSMILISCEKRKTDAATKVWAWFSGSLASTQSDSASDDQLEHYFAKAKETGIDAIILEVHGGYPKVDSADTADFVDYEAINIINKTMPYAKKYGMELHAWLWTTNRCEKNLRAAHPDWYQVNAEGNSCLDIKLYNREHYRWLCPSRPEVLEYLKNRVAELAKIDGIAGVHLDFIRYPDAILPYGLHESRGVVQDKVYPLWDHCYCEVCRSNFKTQTGTDPMTLDNPAENAAWMKYRWDAITKLTNALAQEIHSYGKLATAAVFASPSESRKLVRQDWTKFTELDIIFPMIYHRFYNAEDEWIETATREGVNEMRENKCKGYLCSGLFVGHVPVDKIDEMIAYANNGGSKGICFFSLEGINKTPNYWEKLKESISKYKTVHRK
ncbi:MAG: hypothetical protein LBP63_08860 [Prevotellaceae bacterium]|jgi:uncharacterized lipoprotein YddW (UPF0748 family)|nr:hypothetical protein [Prevotellaceae bacterium]